MNSIYAIFPSTIHPMVVHFTIAIIYLAAFAGLVGAVYRKNTYFANSFLLLILLSGIAAGAAGIAGAISEHYLQSIPQGTEQMLSDHRRDGELTAVFVLIAFVFQVWSWWRHRNRMRVSYLALVFILISVVTVSMAGHLGGTLVYQHGLGVKS